MAEHIAGRATSFDKVEVMEEHMHKESKVYPTLAAAVTATTAAGAWTLGNFVEVVPANTIDEDFDVHWVNVEAVSADDTYELVLYAATTEIGRARGYVKNQQSMPEWMFTCPIIRKNTQIQAKVASALGSSATLDLSVHYHVY